MKTTLTIPKTINVGFQNRGDTYTGKLAFVVYTDAKGVLRKQTSWDGWRDHKIDAKTFDNVPTSGFVLNKKVGENRWGWNPRKAWVRIYDPRDFEFEISVANLLFILEETSAIKGKGLEGDFVYSWDGTELVLLPVTSQEYVSSAEFTELQTKKITKADMVAGCVYRNKDNEQVMYLGRLDWFELSQDYGYGSGIYMKGLDRSKQHVFVSVDGNSKYWVQPGFTKLAERLSTDPSPLFATEFEKFMKSSHGSTPKALIAKPANINPRAYSGEAYLKKGGKYYYVNYSRTSGGWNYGKPEKYFYYFGKATAPVALTEDKKVIIPRTHNRDESISEEDFLKNEFFDLFIENEQGTHIPL